MKVAFSSNVVLVIETGWPPLVRTSYSTKQWLMVVVTYCEG